MTSALVQRRDETVSLPWRLLALVLDVLILGPPIALLCVAGSFGSEATHRQPDPAYLAAAGIALCYALAEGVWGLTPGLLIIGARINATTADGSPKRRILRWTTKYGPFVLPYLVAVFAGAAGEGVGAMTALAALAIWLCAGVVMLVFLGKHVLSRGEAPLYFDEVANTRVVFTRKRRGEAAAV